MRRAAIDRELSPRADQPLQIHHGPALARRAHPRARSLAAMRDRVALALCAGSVLRVWSDAARVLAAGAAGDRSVTAAEREAL